MKFDYTDGAQAKYRVTLRYKLNTDSYLFSDLEKASKFYEAVDVANEDLISVMLVNLAFTGKRARLKEFTKNDSCKLAYYDYKDNVIFINSACLLPHKPVDRKTFSEAFNKSYQQRIED